MVTKNVLTFLVTNVTIVTMEDAMRRSKQIDVRPLNVRNFPDDLYWLCKTRAAQSRMSLKDYIVTVLRRAVSEGMEKKSA